MRSGNVDEGLSDMTGFVCEKMNLHDPKGNFKYPVEWFWGRFLQALELQCLMGCSRSGGTEHALEIDGERTGILTGHAYGICGAFEIPDDKMNKARRTHRIFVVRNPHGQTEWCLKWGSGSEQLQQHREAILDWQKHEDEEEKFDIEADDGLFLINYKSFRTVFNKIFIAVDFPSNFTGVRYTSQWNEESSGGLPKEGTAAALVRYAKNPQYLFKSKGKNCEVFISLA